jgi:hypothetical protein
MAAKKKNKASTVSTGVSLADLNALHTKTHNLFMDATDPTHQEELRLLMRMLSRRIREINDEALEKDTATYRELARSFGAARETAEEALRDLQKLAGFINDLADVVSKLGKLAAAVA